MYFATTTQAIVYVMKMFSSDTVHHITRHRLWHSVWPHSVCFILTTVTSSRHRAARPLRTAVCSCAWTATMTDGNFKKAWICCVHMNKLLNLFCTLFFYILSRLSLIKLWLSCKVSLHEVVWPVMNVCKDTRSESETWFSSDLLWVEKMFYFWIF